MSHRKILITGAGGDIGSVAAYTFLQKGYEVVAVDNFSRGYRGPLEVLQKKYSQAKIRFYEGDIRDLSFLFEKEKNIEAAIHFAALCSVNESMQYPEKYFSENTCASIVFLNTLLTHHIFNIVFSSTCAVYGEAQYMLIDEKHPTHPTNPYGASKLMVENVMRWYSQLKQLKFVSLRYFNVCGASDDGVVGDAKKPSVHLVQNAVRGALGLEPFYLTYPAVETPDKSPIRDYVNVVDLSEAHVSATEYLVKGGGSEIINLGTGTGNSVLEIVGKVEEITGTSIKKEKAPTPRQGEYAKMVASIEKAKKILGWTSRRTITQSITSLIEWYKSHLSGWEK